MRQVLFFFGMMLLAFASFTRAEFNQGATRVDDKFENDTGPWKSDIAAIIKGRLTTRQLDKSPSFELPLRGISAEQLASSEGPVLYRLGHSSILMKLDGEYLLIDPVFSERASPVQWAGPKRFHPVPLEIDDLPFIKAVIISHDHYDHLDKATIKSLAGKVDKFVTPLGVGKHLRAWGIRDEAIVELDWWQRVDLGSIGLVATPAQHFSGRGLFDRNQTLWASWVIESEAARLFFSGDTGYFDGFREIGERYGPFDITMIETGAYNPLWSGIHMLPEQSVQAHLDLRGRAMLPIHNSTFDLSFHPWYEPLELASEIAARRDVKLLTPVIGAAVAVSADQSSYAWWRRPQGEGRDTADVLSTPESVSGS